MFTGFAGALAGGLAGLGGSMGTALMSKAEARRNRQFQERMSSTAVQRQVEDMRKAGINPILAGRYGGSSTPGGAMANIPDFGKAASTAIQGALAKSAIDVQKQTARATGAMADRNEADALVASARARFLLSPTGEKILRAQEASKVTGWAGLAGFLNEMFKSSAKDGMFDRFRSPAPRQDKRKAPYTGEGLGSGVFDILEDGAWRKIRESERNSAR